MVLLSRLLGCQQPNWPASVIATVFSMSAMMSSSRITSVRTKKAPPPADVISQANLLALGNAEAGDNDVRPFFGQRQRSGFADARGASRDKDSILFERSRTPSQRSKDRFSRIAAKWFHSHGMRF
jgi:hypothetical protein